MPLIVAIGCGGARSTSATAPSPIASSSTSASVSAVPSAKPLPPGAVVVTPKPMPNVTWPTMKWDASCAPCDDELTEDVCARCGGHWDVGMFGGRCGCPTVDAGKPCRDDRDCTHNTCSIAWEDAVGHQKTQCNDEFCIGLVAKEGLPWGECTPYRRTFGCQGWLFSVETAYGTMRETRWICRD